MIRELIKDIEECKTTDGRFEIICGFAEKCSASSSDRDRFIKEHFSLHRKRRVREYINDGWYSRLVYNFLIRPIKPLGKKVHPDWDDEFFKGKAFWYYYCTTYRGFVEDIIDNADRYRTVYELLEDDKSKAVLVGVLKGRLSGNKDDFTAVMDPVESQYLDEGVIGHKDNEVFADIGGFDGQSTQDFFDFAVDSKAKSYIFELDHKNAAVIRERFKDDERVSVIEKGCGDKQGVIYYEGGAQTSKVVDHETDKSAQITTVDDEIKEQLTYMKMDVEGAESGVLEGAAGHIRNDDMRMAVCVYHKPGDIWKLYEQIKGYGVEKKYYLRQYGAGEAETVLYAV